MTGALPIDCFAHAAFKASDLGHGVRSFNNCLGFLTSYLVKGNDGLLCTFAFAVNGFDLKQHMHKFVSDDFVARARDVICRKIDLGMLRHRAEYTFEYDLCAEVPVFREVDNPRWWVKW